MLDPKEELHRIDELNRRLYSKDQSSISPRRRGMLHQIGHNVENAWKEVGNDDMKKKVKDISQNTPLFRKFFIGSLIFFVLALSFGAYKFFGGSNTVSGDNIDISVLGNAFTPGGEELSLTVEVANKNASQLEYADLITEYARSGDTGNPADIERVRKTIGTIGAGKISAQKSTVTLYGEEGSTRDISFTLQYRVAGSNAIFEKTKTFTVNISSAPVSLTVDAPKEVSSNQSYTLKVNIIPNAKKPVSSMLMRIEYPTGYQFKESIPTPSYLSNVWNVGDLTPGETKQITITGTLTGQDQEDRSFRIYVGSADTIDKNSIKVVFNSLLYTVTIQKPFIETDLLINGKADDIVTALPHSTVRGEIQWANNLPVRITDAEITATLSGDLIDKTSVQPSGGFYNSAENKIYWNKDTQSSFASIEPGQSGSVGFSFPTYDLYKNGVLNPNPEITISVSIKGKQPTQGNVVLNVDDFVQKKIRFTSNFQLSGQSYYHSGPFTNTGPIPPKAENKTTYTIKWVLTNSSNEMRDVEVRSSMPPYVHFLNSVSPSTESVTIDPTTGDIVWKAGTVVSGSGYTKEAKTVYFQVELNPSLNQVGSTPNLLLVTDATGVDSFTNSTLTAKINEITTRIYNDSGYHTGDEKVTN